MALTPVEVLHTQFRSSLRGYSKQQVDEFLRVAREALEEALKERNELQRRVETLEEEVERVRKIEATMTSAITLAQRSADELRVNAHRQAEMTLREAEQERVRMTVEAQKEAERYRGEIALLQATRDRFRAEFRALLSGYTEWLERGLPTEIVVAEREDSAAGSPREAAELDSAEVA